MADEFDIKQMEKQYIDKRSAMELAYRFATSCVSRFVVDRQIETLEKLIQQIPSADVVEVRHGEWIKKPHWEPLPWDCEPSLSSTPDDYDEKTHSEKVMWWHCSCCDYSPDRGWKPHLNFCPNCGADMRGE